MSADARAGSFSDDADGADANKVTSRLESMRDNPTAGRQSIVESLPVKATADIKKLHAKGRNDRCR
jgi:hypothetical protein